MSFPSPPYEGLKCAFHCHFSWHNQLMLRRPSGLSTVQAFHDAGFDVIALTEHAYESNLGLEKETQRAWENTGSRDNTMVVIGLETSFAENARGRFGGGDCIGLFLEEYVDCLSLPGHKAQSLEWLLDKIHAQDAIAIIAHPQFSYSAKPTGDGIWKWRKEFEIDGWEVFHGGSLFVDRVNIAINHPEETVKEGYIAVASSDSHTPFQAVCSQAACTYALVKERSLKGLKDALVNRRTVAFANGFLYGESEWVERFKSWRLAEVDGRDALLARGIPDAEPGETILIERLDRLSESYRDAHFSGEEYQKELLALSDLTWRFEHSERSIQALKKALASLSQRMFQLNEEEMLAWYKRSYRGGIEELSRNPDNAEASYKAGQAGAFFPGIICSFEEARNHLEKALDIDPAFHVARAALVNLLKRKFPDEALDHCENGLTFSEASPYLHALKRDILRVQLSQKE